MAAVVGLIMITRQGRRFAARRLLPSLKSSLASLGRVARSPVRLVLLRGGSALVTLAYIGGLAAAVVAFGASASIVQVGAVYLAASLLAAASPTPGGIGAIEAALITGLTGIGISSGPAVSAVLLYRLSTYWLPVPPGWYSWRLLQRMEYVWLNQDQVGRCLDGEPERRSARDVEREMGPDVTRVSPTSGTAVRARARPAGPEAGEGRRSPGRRRRRRARTGTRDRRRPGRGHGPRAARRLA